LIPLPEPRPTTIPGDGGRRYVKRSRENR
jgi:hypothetical protein